MSVALTRKQVKILKKCKRDPAYFFENFCKITHPSAGIVDFKLFSYQKRIINDFENPKYKYHIFDKVRQSGISTLCGAYCLWYAMFHADKTVLVVSQTQEHAKDFLRKNVKFIYDFLPSWMREVFSINPNNGGNANVSEVVFPHGSRIKSLTSSPSVMRSHSASLYVIDEAAFIEDMEAMWEGAAPVIGVHSGRCIIISTPKGLGGWYHRHVEEAKKPGSEFHLIKIDWWDMDWEITYNDDYGNPRTISPRKDIRKCETPEEIAKYGPWVSPWLIQQYKLLTTDGDENKFRQEVLHEFLGTGSTILSREILARMLSEITEPIKKVTTVSYRNPNTETVYDLDFKGGLWIWERPYTGSQTKKDAAVVVPNEHAKKDYPHLYAIGADCSKGEGDGDPAGMVVLDLNTFEEVAEFSGRVDTKTFAKMLDFVGRSYNNALLIVERDAWGSAVIKELNEVLNYPNLYRHQKEKNTLKKVYERYGYPPTPVHKQSMVANMVQCLSDQGGWKVRSTRLVKEATIFIQINQTRVGAEPGYGNHDDLMMACCLGLVGAPQAFQTANPLMIPMDSRGMDLYAESGVVTDAREQGSEAIWRAQELGGKNCIAPVIGAVDQATYAPDPQTAIHNEVMKFAKQLGEIPTVVSRQGQGGVIVPRNPFPAKKKAVGGLMQKPQLPAVVDKTPAAYRDDSGKGPFIRPTKKP